MLKVVYKKAQEGPDVASSMPGILSLVSGQGLIE
jgi:hypothetical protein